MDPAEATPPSPPRAPARDDDDDNRHAADDSRHHDSSGGGLRITVHHHGQPHYFTFPSPSSPSSSASPPTVADLHAAIASRLQIPTAQQRLLTTPAQVGRALRDAPDPIALSTLAQHTKKIVLLGSTRHDLASVLDHPAPALAPTPSRAPPAAAWPRPRPRGPSSPYGFAALAPLPHLPQPERSLALLQRLQDDAGIQATMRAHRWTVGLLTEMDPHAHTHADPGSGGVARTLGLNRNQGEVIELRLRTDAFDGYRDYPTIRRTLCHELAHNDRGPHDAAFWALCRQVEREVERADWRRRGRTLSDETFYVPESEREREREGMATDPPSARWRGGTQVLGLGRGPGAAPALATTGLAPPPPPPPLAPRELVARAAEERMRRARAEAAAGPGAAGAAGAGAGAGSDRARDGRHG